MLPISPGPSQGITMATRFLCTEEAPIQRAIKEHMAYVLVDLSGRPRACLG